MAEASHPENKNYGKLLQRNFSRTLERMKSTLGKADKTLDEEFDRQALIFKEQQAVANRLHRGLKAYVTHANAMAAVTEDLFLAMRDAYEVDWDDSKAFRERAEKVPVVKDAFVDAMHERAVSKMHNYNSQFSPMKTLIAKRSRKLVDYDAARHRKRSLEGAKKRNETKISQAQEKLVTTKHVYDRINQDLLRELPKLYDSRVVSLCSCFEVVLNTEQEFSTKLSTVNKEMAEIVSKMRARAVEEAEQRNATSNGLSAEQLLNAYDTQLEMTSSDLSSSPPSDDVTKQNMQPDESQSSSEPTGQGTPSSTNRQISSEALKKENASPLEASYSPPLYSGEKSPTHFERSSLKEKNQQPARPATGPTGFTPGRPAVSAVGVVADVHKDNSVNPAAGKASVQQTSVSFSDTSKNDGSQSPAVVQQQMMLKKRREEELLKQQMLKQRQQEEYLKQQQQQQLQRQQELQRREEEAMMRRKQQQQQKQQMLLQQHPKEQQLVKLQPLKSGEKETQQLSTQQTSAEKKDELSKQTSSLDSKDSTALAAGATVTPSANIVSASAATASATATVTTQTSVTDSDPTTIANDTTATPAESISDATAITVDKTNATSSKVYPTHTVNATATGDSNDTVVTPALNSDSKVSVTSSLVASDIPASGANCSVEENIVPGTDNSAANEQANDVDAVVCSNAAITGVANNVPNSQNTESSSPDSKPSSPEDVLDAIIGGTGDNSKDVVLYSVIAINEYTGDDKDELNLEPGNVINVFELRSDQEPLDDGWLYGLNTATKVRGLFPENFTKKV